VPSCLGHIHANGSLSGLSAKFFPRLREECVSLGLPFFLLFRLSRMRIREEDFTARVQVVPLRRSATNGVVAFVTTFLREEDEKTKTLSPPLCSSHGSFHSSCPSQEGKENGEKVSGRIEKFVPSLEEKSSPLLTTRRLTALHLRLRGKNNKIFEGNSATKTFLRLSDSQAKGKEDV